MFFTNSTAGIPLISVSLRERSNRKVKLIPLWGSKNRRNLVELVRVLIVLLVVLFLQAPLVRITMTRTNIVSLTLAEIPTGVALTVVTNHILLTNIQQVKVFGGIQIPQVATGNNFVLPSCISPAVSEAYVPIVKDIVADYDLGLSLNVAVELSGNSLNNGINEVLHELSNHAVGCKALSCSTIDLSQDDGTIPVRALKAPAVCGKVPCRASTSDTNVDFVKDDGFALPTALASTLSVPPSPAGMCSSLSSACKSMN